MKKNLNFMAFAMMAVFCFVSTGCNSNNTSHNQSYSEQYSDEESENSQYILAPSTLYEGTVNGGFSLGFLTTNKENNETSFQIKTYRDGGVTFSFDNKVYVEGWGWNMSGEIEGKWDMKSFSYHDVEYNVVVIKCKQTIYPTYYEDSNHTPLDRRHTEVLTVEMIVDKDLNFYFTEGALMNHMAAGKLVRK